MAVTFTPGVAVALAASRWNRVAAPPGDAPGSLMGVPGSVPANAFS